MPLEFTLVDVGKMAAALCLLPLILVLPGYAIARALGIAHFSHRPTWQRLLLALLLSIGVMPAIAYLTGRTAGMSAAFAVTLLCSCISTVFLFRDGPRRRRAIWRPFAYFCAGWTAIVFFSMVDLQIGHRLYPSAASFDLSFRSIITEQFAQFREVPGNPFFFDGQPIVLRYHYFWFIYCSLLERLTMGWLPGRLILSASSVWLAASIGWLLILFVRYFQPARAGKGKRASIALALVFVGGLDVLAVGLLYALGWMNRPPPTLEWWNPQQITTWVDQFLWIPNHVAALVACLLAVLLLVTDIVTSKRRTSAALVAGICLGSASGLSIYVAFTTVVFLTVWGLSLMVRREWSRFTTLAVCGAAALLATLPYLLEMLGSSGGGGRGSQFAKVAFRPFLLWRTAILAAFPDIDLIWQGLGDIVLLPVQYFLELGFFFLALLWGLKKRSRQPSIAVQIAWTSFFIGTLLQSVAAHGNNDLGWRCFMPAQFIALLWGAEMIAATKLGRVAVFALGLGIFGTAVEVCWLRGFLPWIEARAASDPAYADNINRTHSWLIEIRQFGERAYDARRAYDWLNRTLPVGARIQHTPNTGNDLLHGSYSQRTAFLDGLLAAESLGIAPARVAAVRATMDASSAAGASLDRAMACSAIPRGAWVVKDTDPLWRDRESWVWRTTASFRNRHYAVFVCRP